MSRSFALLVFCSLAFAHLAQAAPGDKAKPSPSAATQPLLRTTEEMQQLRTDRYALAQTVSTELTTRLALPSGAVAQQITACVDHLLGVDTEAGFVESAVEIYSLDLLLQRYQATMQRNLAPILPPDAYDRYVALLDERGVVAQ